MTKGWVVVVALFVIIIVGTIILVIVPTPTVKAPSGETATTTKVTGTNLTDTIVVDSPVSKAAITSPLTISGKARGNWYFEGSAPVALLDQNGAVIAQGTISSNGEWMTTDFVPFTAELTFPAQPAGSTGTLVLKNDNPSGDPSRQKTLDIPVRF